MTNAAKGGKVYVANVTSQNHILNFRLPEARKPLSVSIPMGQQRLVGDLSPPEIDAMVYQLGPYGLAELGQESAKAKLAYIFSVGSPVPASAMQRIIDRNRGILRDEGVKRRQETAVAAHDLMNSESTPMKGVVVELEEVDSGSLGSDSEKIGEGIRIDDQSTSENKPPRRGKGKNK